MTQTTSRFSQVFHPARAASLSVCTTSLIDEDGSSIDEPRLNEAPRPSRNFRANRARADPASRNSHSRTRVQDQVDKNVPE